MRAEANELQCLVIRLPIDKHKIGLDMTIAVIDPISGQWMVLIVFRQWPVSGQ